LINSTVLELEISKISDTLKKEQIEQYLLLTKQKLLVTKK